MGGRVNAGNYGDIFDHHFVEFTYGDGTKVFSQSRHIGGTWDQVNEFAHGDKGSRNVSLAGGPKLEAAIPTTRSMSTWSRRSLRIQSSTTAGTVR